MIGTLNLRPLVRILLAEVLDDLLGLGRHFQFRVSGSEQQDVSLGMSHLRRLLPHGAIGCQEHNRIEDDKPDSDDRPAPRRHIFMPYWDQHSRSPSSTPVAQ